MVHHTGSGESSTYAEADVPAMLRAVQAYHMDANGWNDIGYNFVVDRFRRIWEAGRAGSAHHHRRRPRLPGLFTSSLGVVVLGDFRSAVPGAAAAMDWRGPVAGLEAVPPRCRSRRNGTGGAHRPATPAANRSRCPASSATRMLNSTGCRARRGLPAATTGRRGHRYRAAGGKARLTDGTIGGPGSVGRVAMPADRR
ncbi:MAG: hypothetical protein R2749_21865 [Acidimicrobiales bacterium]